MADPLKQICDELGVSKEEALFYLEGFQWDLNAATEACRSKTLPPTENERAAAEEQSRNEMIVKFLEVAYESSSDDARTYLSDKNWNLEAAVHSFFDHAEKKSKSESKPVPLPHEGGTDPWYLQGFSGGNKEGDVMEDVLSKLPEFHNTSMDLRIGSPSKTPFELIEESVREFRAVLDKAPLEAVIDCLTHCKGNVADAINYFYGDYSKARPGIATAEVVKDFSGMAVDQDSSIIPTETQGSLEKPGEGEVTVAIPGMAKAHVKEGSPRTSSQDLLEEPSQSENDLIDLLVLAGDGVVTRDVATIYLRDSNWNVEKAFTCLMAEENTMQVQASQEGSKNVCSSSNADPTETGDVTVAIPGMASSQVDTTESLPAEIKEELIASFSLKTGATRKVAKVYLEQYKWNRNRALNSFQAHSLSGEQTSVLKGKAVEESSSTETVLDPVANRDRTTVETQTAPSTIMITICLADEIGTSLELPFRSNQTVGDIRNAIDQRYPDNDRGYYLQSKTGVDYMDGSITVYRVSTGGSTTLLQTYP